MINNKLAQQAVDKILNNGDESLRRLGCGTFRRHTAEAAKGVCSNPILNEIAALESKYGGVCLEFVESAISLVESRLAQLLNDRRWLMQQLKEVVNEIRQLKIDEPYEVKLLNLQPEQPMQET